MCFNFLCNIQCEKYFYSDQFKIKFYIPTFIINFNKKEKELINVFRCLNEFIILLIFIKISIKAEKINI